MPEPQTGVTGGGERKAPNASSKKGPSRLRPKTQRGTSQPSPTRSIEPGAIHYQIAGGILRGVQEKAREAGVNLDIGELPEEGTITDASDPTKIARNTAHAVARIGDRVSIFRKVSRHLEGQDKRAGLLSDLVAVVYSLIERNPEAVRTLAQSAGSDFKARRMQRAVEKGTNNNQPGGIA